MIDKPNAIKVRPAFHIDARLSFRFFKETQDLLQI